jgi:hypothetical protein
MIRWTALSLVHPTAGTMSKAALDSMLGPGDIVDNLEIQISGRIQSSNFPVWKNALLDQIALINLKLITDNYWQYAISKAREIKRLFESSDTLFGMKLTIKRDSPP